MNKDTITVKRYFTITDNTWGLEILDGDKAYYIPVNDNIMGVDLFEVVKDSLLNVNPLLNCLEKVEV